MYDYFDFDMVSCAEGAAHEGLHPLWHRLAPPLALVSRYLFIRSSGRRLTSGRDSRVKRSHWSRPDSGLDHGELVPIVVPIGRLNAHGTTFRIF